MNLMPHTLLACLALTVATLAAIGHGAWPTRTIRIITPAPAGTSPDIFARLYADQLGKSLGQSGLKPAFSDVAKVRVAYR